MDLLEPIYNNIPTNRLILQSAGRIKCNEYGMDTRTKIYKGHPSVSETLAAAMVGTSDPDYPGLEAIDFEVTTGKVMDDVSINFKGIINLDNLKAPFPTNDTPLQSATVNDNGYNDPTGNGNQSAVSFQYYAPSTTWKYCMTEYPNYPLYDSILGNSFVISPFNTNPPTPPTDLNYEILAEVTHFHVEPAGRYWEVENTSAIILIAHNLPPLIEGLRKTLRRELRKRYPKGKLTIKLRKKAA